VLDERLSVLRYHLEPPRWPRETACQIMSARPRSTDPRRPRRRPSDGNTSGGWRRLQAREQSGAQLYPVGKEAEQDWQSSGWAVERRSKGRRIILASGPFDRSRRSSATNADFRESPARHTSAYAADGPEVQLV
jgi:hypothetical protein